MNGLPFLTTASQSSLSADSSNVWLHFMGLIIGLIGGLYLSSTGMVRMSYWFKAVRLAHAQRVPAPKPISVNLPSGARVVS